MKIALQPKGILLGLVLLLMAIASTVVVQQLRNERADTEDLIDTADTENATEVERATETP